MAAHRLLIAVLLSIISCGAHASRWSPFTASWDEEVLLRDGRVLQVRRTITYGPDVFPPRGSGPLLEQSITFAHGGQRIQWSDTDKSIMGYTPDILDFVDGAPVIVMPVYFFTACKKYGFPQDGMIAFILRRNKWETVSVASLPKGLKVNLWSRTARLPHHDEYKDKRIDQAEKQRYRTGERGPKLGEPIEVATKFYTAQGEESCAFIRPLPDPQLDAAKVRNYNAGVNAKTVVATAADPRNKPDGAAAAEFAQANAVQKINWQMSVKCAGIVKSVEPIRRYEDTGSWHLLGEQLVTTTGTKIPVVELDIKPFQAPAFLYQVTCDRDTIYAIRRKDKGSWLLHRFTHAGDLIDALKIRLADVDKTVAGNGWGDPKGLAIADGRLSFTLADEHGQRTYYAIKLP
jgi:hypothetical protein